MSLKKCMGAILLISSLLSSVFATGSWLSEEKIASSGATLGLTGFSGNHSSIVVDSSGNPAVTWFSGNPSKVMFSRRSSQGGWREPISVTTVSFNSRYPSLSISPDGDYHLAWHDYRHGQINNLEIYYNRSDDKGLTWPNETRLTISNDQNTTNGDNGYIPLIRTDSNSIQHIVWYDYHWNGWRPELCHRKMTSPATWNAVESMDDFKITSSALYENPFPDFILTQSGTPFIVWSDDSAGSVELFSISQNPTTHTWNAVQQITYLGATAQFPSLTQTSENTLHLFYSLLSRQKKTIYYQSLSPLTQAWSAPTIVSENAQQATSPVCAVDNKGILHIVWSDLVNGKYRLFYKTFNPGMNVWSSQELITNGEGDAQYPGLSVDKNNSVHLIWQDNRDSESAIYYRVLMNATDVTKWDIYE